MFDQLDPRDRDSDPREIDMPWVSLGRGPASDRGDDDSRDGEEARRDRTRRDRGRGRDARDVFLDHLDLPRTPDREVVFDRDHRYELNGDESRSLATVGAFRVVAERDIAASCGDRSQSDSLAHLRNQKLVRFVSLDGRNRAVTLTRSGRHLLEAHRRDLDDGRPQAFYADASRPRERAHDTQLYRAFRREAKRLQDDGADIRRIVLEQDLKREYQQWLQDHNRGRADSDGRPDRDPREIVEWAREHQLPASGGSVEFPDFRIEYEINGLEQHIDVEVVTPHYRGAHAASRSGFSCHNVRRDGSALDPDLAADFL